MEIRYWGRQSPEAIDQCLQTLLMRRLDGYDVENDFVIAYEPSEAFSMRRDDDLRSIRSRGAFKKYCEAHHVPLIITSRGGGMIWHGPGQVCLAPLVNIAQRKIDVAVYAFILEETCIRTIRQFGVRAEKNHYHKGSQGAWVRGKKIGFFAAYFRRGFAFHGTALNVSPDLYPFSLIDPCNLPGVYTTSIKEEMGTSPAIYEVGIAMAEEFVRLIHEATKK